MKDSKDKNNSECGELGHPRTDGHDSKLMRLQEHTEVNQKGYKGQAFSPRTPTNNTI